ncbi:hypothetical protein LIER_21834 [Lithospermum erythrorhizon]|uniref:Uncharacterized protein n=1 Tax=Lithospermum erythrorhizon TaxID=34254 RepID=A0AAV3QSQ5_LITER
MRVYRNQSMAKKSIEDMKLIATVLTGVAFGFLIGASFPIPSLTKINVSTSILRSDPEILDPEPVSLAPSSLESSDNRTVNQPMKDRPKMWVPSNPQGAETLPPGIVVPRSDFITHPLSGDASEDLKTIPKYLVAFTVGYDQKKNIEAAVEKFSDNFTIVLFHYDGRTTEWDELDWSKRAIHISVPKQTKWWYAKRFLHPDIVAQYEYIFIWDEDLGLENFDAEEYIKLIKKHGLEISQPALDPSRGITWQMTKKRDGQEVHKQTDERPGWCSDPHQPPCASFVEIMAPVFSNNAWRCVWYMIQNDLVHGWGLDYALQKCVQPAHEKIGVVDAQWIVHQSIPSLGNQGKARQGKTSWQRVRDRCKSEWRMFQERMHNAEIDYYKSIGVDTNNIKLKLRD